MKRLRAWVAWIVIALELSGALVCYSYIVPPLPPGRYIKGFGDDNRPSIGQSYGLVLAAPTILDDNNLSLGAAFQLCHVMVGGCSGSSCTGALPLGVEESRGPGIVGYMKLMGLGWSMGVLMHYASFSMMASLFIMMYSASRMGYFYCDGCKIRDDIRYWFDLPIDRPLSLSDASVATNTITKHVSAPNHYYITAVFVLSFCFLLRPSCS